MQEVTKEIIKHYGILSESEKGWTKELNLVSWNGRDPRFDIREWAPDKNKTGKGITMKQAEFGLLKSIVNSIESPSDATNDAPSDAPSDAPNAAPSKELIFASVLQEDPNS